MRQPRIAPLILFLVLLASMVFSCARPMPTPAPMPTPSPAPAAPSVAQRTMATVVKVIDGDTIEVDIGGKLCKVRYIGISSPKIFHPSYSEEPYGGEAYVRNKELVEGKAVELERDVLDTDEQGNLLRYVYVDGLFVNAELVRLGYARSEVSSPNTKYQSLLSQLEAEAKEAHCGFWATSPPVTMPPPQPLAVPPRTQAALNRVNFYRGEAGVTPVNADPYLGTAATGHAEYCVDENLLTHEETNTSNPHYRGQWPQDRANAAGYSHYAFENGAEGYHQNPDDAVDVWMGGVYHRWIIIHPDARDLGYGSATNQRNFQFLEVGFPSFYPNTYVAVQYPGPGQANVPTDFSAEEVPNPIGGDTSAGYPVTVSFPIWSTVTLSSVWLKDSSNNTVPSYDSMNTSTLSPSYAYMWYSVAIVAHDPLAYGETYTAHVSGTVTLYDGSVSNFDLTWSFTTVSAPANQPPSAPTTPSGAGQGWEGTSYGYSTSATDPDGDQVSYIFDWGDGTTTTTALGPSGWIATESHSWSGGDYNVKVMATDEHGATSNWSNPLTVHISARPVACPVHFKGAVATDEQTGSFIVCSPTHYYAFIVVNQILDDPYSVLYVGMNLTVCYQNALDLTVDESVEVDGDYLTAGPIPFVGRVAASSVLCPPTGKVKFKGSVTSNEAYGQAVCYGSYYVDLTIDQIIRDVRSLLVGVTSVQVCYQNPLNLTAGESVEVYGYYWKGLGPMQMMGRTAASGGAYYIARLAPPPPGPPLQQ